MNQFTFYNNKCDKPGVFQVSVVLLDRFVIAHEADGWRIYSTCNCLWSAHLWPTKRKALEGLRDFLNGVDEQQLRKSNSAITSTHQEGSHAKPEHH
jgi:hypothetical protein